MSRCVLDASALLALLFDEPGANAVATALAEGEAVMSAVNYGETVARLAAVGMQDRTIRSVLEPLKVDIVPLDRPAAMAAGLLYPQTKKLGLSLGDRYCLALAKSLNVPAMTADRAWAALKIDVSIKVIR